MKKNRIFNFAYFLALVFIVNILSGYKTVEASSASIEIEVVKKDELMEALGEDTDKVKVSFWKVSPEITSDAYKAERAKILDGLHKLSIEDLNTKYQKNEKEIALNDNKILIEGLDPAIYYFRNIYQSSTTSYKSEFLIEVKEGQRLQLVDKAVTESLEAGQVKLIKKDQDGNRLENVGFELYDQNGNKVPLMGNYNYLEDGESETILYTDSHGEINVKDLPFGKYYFKEVKGLEGYKITEDKIEFTLENSKLVEVEVVNERLESGGFNFIKIANDKKKSPLEGAVFKLTGLVDGKYQPVIQKGKEVILKSDGEGKFSISGLAYGKYQLWEVEAPKGYRKLVNNIEFTVDEKSHEKVLFITNEKESKIVVPKTGDLMIPILLAVAAFMFTSGYKLSREKK